MFAFLVNFPVQTGSKFRMGGVRLALHEIKIFVSRYLLPLLFVLLLLLYLHSKSWNIKSMPGRLVLRTQVLISFSF